jgi:hypothetical protein
MTPLDFLSLFPRFQAFSWQAWRGVFARLTDAFREVWVLAGRGSGKSSGFCAPLACYFASREYPNRAPGESIYVGVFAPDRKQAGVTFRYVSGLLRSVPELAALIVSESKESIELTNGVIVEVLTANKAAPRGRSYALAIIEEAVFLPTDTSANPDIELLRALRPALARVPGSLLAVVGSTYARKGILWQAWQKYHLEAPADVLFVQATTLELNSTFDAAAIDKAYEDDPASAAAEYGAQFRSDVESYVSAEALEAVTVLGRRELPPQAGLRAHGVIDFAGGGSAGSDSAAVGISYGDAERRVSVLAYLLEVKPPFSPAEVCARFADVLRAYGITTAMADRWAGQFPVEQMRQHGIVLEPSARSKSDLFRECLPLIHSRSVELLDHPRLIAQLTGLERRTSRGGKDSIDHAPGAHDDVANVAAAALVLAAERMSGRLSPDVLAKLFAIGASDDPDLDAGPNYDINGFGRRLDRQP